MKIERTDVKFPLWRKKVDKSLLEGVTPIPGWCCKQWNVESLFGNCISKNDKNSETKIKFKDEEYKGWVTVSREDRPTPLFRLFFEENLSNNLKGTFQMSYIRALESKLSKQNEDAIETRSPFWEFLDIEFDAKEKTFVFVSHYIQEPIFPEVFKMLLFDSLNR